MANNGDITHTDIESFLKIGSAFPTTSNTTLTEDDVDALCTSINSEVNLILTDLGFSLPITATDSIQWLKMVKQHGAGSLVLDGLASQATEENNTRAQRLWDRYRSWLDQLIESGGDILDAPKQTDPVPSTLPVVFGQYDEAHRKRYLRFPQRARVDHLDNEEEIADSDFAGQVRGF